LSAVVAVLALVSGLIQAWRDARAVRDAQRRVQAEPTIESRLHEVAASMSRASEMMTWVQTEIEARAEWARQLAAEAAQSEQIVSLTKAQKDAVAAVFHDQVARG
jgi:hypothetical protein